MRPMRLADRLLILLTGLVAAHQVVAGIEGLDAAPTLAYTVAFGVLLITTLLLLLLGFEVLGTPAAAVVTTVFPISLALGLVWHRLPAFGPGIAAFSGLGLLALALARLLGARRLATVIQAIVHGAAGLVIFALPVVLVIRRVSPPAFLSITLGGALFGAAGLALLSRRMGKPILTEARIFELFPALLLATTLAFAAGLAFG